MARFVRPSRISAGKGCRRGISGAKGLSRSRHPAEGGINTVDGMVNTGAKGKATGAEVSNRQSGRLYEVFDVCDRSIDSDEHYRVRWKGFKDRRYDTYEPASKLKRLGFKKVLEEVDEYIIWRAKYLKEHPERRRAPNIYKFRKSKGSPIYAANENFTCVSMALNTMCYILKINFLFGQTIIDKFHGNQGFRYSRLCKMVQHQQKILKINFLSLEGIKYNRIKGCHNNMEMILNKLSKESGVFLSGARSGAGLYHMFVLRVHLGNIYVYDSSMGMTNELISSSTFSWISEWRIILKATKEGCHQL